MVTFYSATMHHYRARINTTDGLFDYDGMQVHDWKPVKLDAPLDGYLPSMVYYTATTKQ